jgi:hypothetical protein
MPRRHRRRPLHSELPKAIRESPELMAELFSTEFSVQDTANIPILTEPKAAQEIARQNKRERLFAISERDAELLKQGASASVAFDVWQRSVEGLRYWAEINPNAEGRREILAEIAASEARMQDMIDRHGQEHREHFERRIEEL